VELRPFITAADVPDLFGFFDRIEQMRLVLTKVIERLDAIRDS
jgi:hypothetical protein